MRNSYEALIRETPCGVVMERWERIRDYHIRWVKPMTKSVLQQLENRKDVVMQKINSLKHEIDVIKGNLEYWNGQKKAFEDAIAFVQANTEPPMPIEEQPPVPWGGNK